MLTVYVNTSGIFDPFASLPPFTICRQHCNHGIAQRNNDKFIFSVTLSSSCFSQGERIFIDSLSGLNTYTPNGTVGTVHFEFPLKRSRYRLL